MVTCTQSGKKKWIYQDKKKNPKGKRREKETKSLYMNDSVYFYLKKKESLSQLHFRLVDNDNLKRAQVDMLSHQSAYSDSLLYNCL
jgi:hypothetical protein